MKSPLMRILGMTVWVITALAAINMGLISFGFNIFTTQFVLMRMHMLILPMYYIIGLSGLISLGMFVMHCMCACSSCGSSEGCSCGK